MQSKLVTLIWNWNTVPAHITYYNLFMHLNRFVFKHGLGAHIEELRRGCSRNIINKRFLFPPSHINNNLWNLIKTTLFTWSEEHRRCESALHASAQHLEKTISNSIGSSLILKSPKYHSYFYFFLVFLGHQKSHILSLSRLHFIKINFYFILWI